MRWGTDAEERSAVAIKAQNAYAVARQALERAAAAEAAVADLRRELVALRAVLDGLAPAKRRAER